MIYLLLTTVVGVCLTVIAVHKVLDMTDDSLTAAVLTGMGMFCAILIAHSFIIDAIVEGRIAL